MAVVSDEIRKQAEDLVLPVFSGMIDGLIAAYLQEEGSTPSTLSFVARMRAQQAETNRQRVEVVAQFLQRKADAAAVAPAPVEAEPVEVAPAEQEYSDWRVRPTSKNAGYIVPNRIGAKFTPQQRASIVRLAQSLGYNALDEGPTKVWVIDNKTYRPIRELDDYGARGAKRMARVEREEKRAQAEAARKAETKAAAESAVSRPWIVSVFGEDAMNTYNSNALSDYLEGRTKTFEGLVGSRWVDGLRSLSAIDASGRADIEKVRAAYLATTAPAPVEVAPSERFTYAATIRPITDAFWGAAARLYDPQYTPLAEIPERYGYPAQRHGIVSVNQRLPLDFQRHMDLRLIAADGPRALYKEIEHFINERASDLAKDYADAFVNAAPGDEYDRDFMISDITRRIREEVREKYGDTDALDWVNQERRSMFKGIEDQPGPVTAALQREAKKRQATPAPAPAASGALTIRMDGIEGVEVPWYRVPLGSDAFQYAVGRLVSDEPEIIARRKASERGTYGGWRWEASVDRLLPATAPAPAPVEAAPAAFSDPGLQAVFGHLTPEPLAKEPDEYIIKQWSDGGAPVYSMRAGGQNYADTTPDLAKAIEVAKRWGVQTDTYYDTTLPKGAAFLPLVSPEPSEPVEAAQAPDPEPAMGAYGEYLASLPVKEREKARKVLDAPFAMRESRNAEPIRGTRAAIIEQLLDRQRSMPYRPLEPGESISGKSGPLLINFDGYFAVKPQEHDYALWLYPRLVAAEKEARAVKKGVDKPPVAPINYAAIIEGEANRIFALYTQQVAP